MILVSKGWTLFRSMGTISDACSPVALTMVDTTLHRSSKFPWVPCTRSRSVKSLLIRLRISGPEKTSLVVQTPAPNERNSVSLGKGVPLIWTVCGLSGMMKLTDFLGFTSCPVCVCMLSYLRHRISPTLLILYSRATWLARLCKTRGPSLITAQCIWERRPDTRRSGPFGRALHMLHAWGWKPQVG